MLCLIALWCCFGAGILTPFLLQPRDSQWSVFAHVVSSYAHLLRQKKFFCIRKKFSYQDWFGTPTWLPFHCFGGNTNMVDVTSCENGVVSKTFPLCISTKYLPSLNTITKWPAGNWIWTNSCVRLIVFWNKNRQKFVANFFERDFLNHSNVTFILIRLLILTKILDFTMHLKPDRWFSESFFFHLLLFQNTFNRTSHSPGPFIPVPLDKGKADSDCGIHDSVFEVPAA